MRFSHWKKFKTWRIEDFKRLIYLIIHFWQSAFKIFVYIFQLYVSHCSEKKLPLIKNILVLPTWGQIYTVSVLQPILSAFFLMKHPVRAERVFYHFRSYVFLFLFLFSFFFKKKKPISWLPPFFSFLRKCCRKLG